MKPKAKIEAEEINSTKTPTGQLILNGICNQANVVCSIASSLSEFGSPYYSYRYGNDNDGDEQQATDVPEAVMEMVSAMKDSAKNLLRMVNSFARAESGPSDVTIDGLDADDLAPADTDESFVMRESATGEMTVVFTEAGTATVTKGEISGTMIVAGMNANRTRFYTEESLQDAAGRSLWNGKKMYLDHMTASDKAQRPERSVKDIAAIIKETRYDAGSKSIKYRATLADPALETKLAYMQERGILSGLGVSIHAAGQGRKEMFESSPTFVVEKFLEAYSTDFVTTPGAGGSIDLLESDPTGRGSRAEAGENSMDEKTMAALLESVKGIVTAAVAPVAESQAKMQNRLDAVEAQTKIKNVIEATTLPAAAKSSLLTQFADATSTDGVDAAITGMTQLVESLTPAKDAKATDVKESGTRFVGKPSPVHGMGAQKSEEAVVKKATIEDFANSPAIALLGGKERGTKLLESLR